MEWVLFERPGFSGRRRAARHELWNKTYGKEGWKQVWTYEKNFLNFEEVCKKYEDAYFEHAKKHPDIWLELLEYASDVYDTNKSNVESKKDYLYQEAESTHIQDIAVRNVVERMGWNFNLNGKIIRVRKQTKEGYDNKTDWGYYLSPGVVNYHEPKMIEKPSLAQLKREEKTKPWWRVWTVEDMYQSNKWLAIKKSILEERGEYSREMRSFYSD